MKRVSTPCPETLEAAGVYVARAAKHYMLSQIEAGVCCPLTMTFASVPVLCQNDMLADRWLPHVLSDRYDARPLPVEEKEGVLIGMAMTEKQGGSDLRANRTQATPLSGAQEEGCYALTGHKYFVSAPMADAFLTLAQTEHGVSCFLLPRFLPEGSRNRFFFQRLKDKLGNHSNATAEIELDRALGVMLGEEGHGVRAIMEMVVHTRMDCTLSAAGLMRQGLVQAIHYSRQRKAFGKRLCDHALMQNVLCDLAIESEAATSLALFVAQGYDLAALDESQRPPDQPADFGGEILDYQTNPGDD